MATKKTLKSKRKTKKEGVQLYSLFLVAAALTLPGFLFVILEVFNQIEITGPLLTLAVNYFLYPIMYFGLVVGAVAGVMHVLQVKGGRLAQTAYLGLLVLAVESLFVMAKLLT
jgi:hypothetical protein